MQRLARACRHACRPCRQSRLRAVARRGDAEDLRLARVHQSVELLRKASKENTVTVVHLIYRSKNYESSSKDYDFSHVGVVEHWNAGARDVHLSMRHKEWLERPQSGETMVTYDLTGEESKIPAARKQE